MNEIGTVFNLGLGLILLWALFFFGWRHYRIDNVRDKLFQLRNELFLLAVEGDVSFGDPAYRVLRNRLNAVIRFAHTITLTQVVLYGAQIKSPPDLHQQEARQNWTSAVQKLPAEQQQKIMDIDQRAAFIIAWQLFSGSPILWLIAFVYVPILFFRSAIDSLPKDFRQQATKDLRVDVIEEQAVMEFKREECAVDERQLANA